MNTIRALTSGKVISPRT